MKIGIFFPLNEYGGVQTCVISLIKGLNKKNIVPYIIWEDEPSQKILDENNLKVKFEKVKFIISRKTINNLPHFLRYLLIPFTMVKASSLKNRYDFIYLFTHNFYNDLNINYYYYISGPPFLPQLYPQKGFSYIRFKLISMIYKLFIKQFFPVYEFHYEVSKCSINSKYTSDLFYEAHNIRLEVVYPSNFIKKSSEIGFKNKKDAIFLSRITPYKRPEFIIELAKKYRNINFNIVGIVTPEREKYLEELQEIVNKFNLKNIKFIINEDYQVVRTYLEKSKIYIFPSINEHFGITTVEAIMKGTIPFVHNSGGQKEIVDLDELRFEDDDFLTKFEQLINRNDNELIKYQEHFYNHSDNFDEEIFTNKLLERLKR